MGKDQSKDENATTKNKDHSRDQESRDAALAKTIAVAVAGALTQQKAEETQSIAAAVAGALRQQKSEETQSIAEAVALQTRSITEVVQQTKSITETFSRQMEKTHAQYEELLKGPRTELSFYP